MTFYGIDKTTTPLKIHQFQSSTAKPPVKAMDWASGGTYRAGSDFVETPGRCLYMAPRGWMRPRNISGEALAKLIEEICQGE